MTKNMNLSRLVFLTMILALATCIYGLMVDAEAAKGAIAVMEKAELTSPSDFVNEARLATGVADDGFAINVAMSGDTAMIATVTGYLIYVRSGATWTQQAVLTPSDGLGVVDFPYAIAISGNTAVIGGHKAAVGANFQQGAVYVFVRNGITWTEQQRLTASDGATGHQFGISVAIDGETIVVGAHRAAINGAANAGAAYVYVRNGTSWTEQSKLIAGDGAANNFFGTRVSISSDTAVVTRTRRNNGSDLDPAAYIFVRNGTAWSQQQKLSICEPSVFNSCGFGTAIAISGDTCVVSNPALIVGGQSAGGAYVFTRTAGNWTLQQRLTAPNGLDDDGFGTSLGTEGDTLIAGASADNVRPGTAYVFSRSANVWTQRQKLQEPSPVNSNIYGKVLAISGSRVLVSAGRDQGTLFNSIGAAYIYLNANLEPTPTPTPTPVATPTPTPTPVSTSTPTPTPVLTVSVSGRVTTPGGLGLRNAVVSLTNSQGAARTATTSSFGVYSFSNIVPGEQYLIGVSSKRYRFASQSLMVDTDLSNVDFVGLE